MTEKGIAIGCRGCGQPVLLLFAVLTSEKAVLEYLKSVWTSRKRRHRRKKKS